jgi:hypothetical protein
MSRIYFHSPSGNREIYGPERAWMRLLTEELAFGVLRLAPDPRRLAAFLPPGVGPRDALREAPGSHQRFFEALRMWSRTADTAWVVDGREYDAWQLTLNTVLAIGSDPVKLCARLHGQCEIHAYTEGPNRSWLANLIRQGIGTGVMRDDGYPRPDGGRGAAGQWAELAAWLQSREDEPAVTSYSVCEPFPNPGVAGADGKEARELWYAQPPARRWESALAGLRGNHPELTPDDWDDYRFGHGKDAFWLVARATGG